MDSQDKRVLSLLQTEFPVAARPFDALAARHGRGPCRGRKRLGTEPEDLLARVRRLAEGGVIRRIGPVFDSRRLGYTSTLAAARVPTERLAEVAARVNRLPGVTHNYERRGAYNLWFTLTAQSEKEIAETLDALGEETGIVFHSLPALAVYKIRAVFGADDTPSGDPLHGRSGLPAVASAKAGGPPRKESAPAELDDKQKQLVRALQDGV